MPKKKTHEQFIKEFNEKNPNANNIEILGKYESGKKPILCRCKIHNYTWSPKAEQLLANKKCCPIGANNLITTTEEFIKELEKINPNIEVLGKYINSKTPIACRCKIDGYEWSPTPDNLRQRKGCHKCANIVKRTHEEFVKEMYSINPNIKILSNFIDTHTYVKCECLIDGNIWEAEPRHLLDKHGCPQCSDSIGEKEIAKYLNNNNIEYNPQYKFEDLEQIYVNVRDAAYHIIERKRATYYGIGMALARIVKAILSDENSSLSVSVYLNGQYGQHDVFVGVPAIINRNGVREVFELNITGSEREKLTKSVNVLKETLAIVK